MIASGSFSAHHTATLLSPQPPRESRAEQNLGPHLQNRRGLPTPHHLPGGGRRSVLVPDRDRQAVQTSDLCARSRRRREPRRPLGGGGRGRAERGRGRQPGDAGRLRADRGRDGEAVRGLRRAGAAVRQRAAEDLAAVGRAVAGDAAAVQRGHRQEDQEDGGRGGAPQQESDPLGRGEEAPSA